MKPFTDKEWAEFQQKVIEASKTEKLMGVNFFTTTITVKFKRSKNA